MSTSTVRSVVCPEAGVTKSRTLNAKRQEAIKNRANRLRLRKSSSFISAAFSCTTASVTSFKVPNYIRAAHDYLQIGMQPICHEDSEPVQVKACVFNDKWVSTWGR